MISNYAERHGVILPPSGLVQTVFSSVRLHFGWKGDMERWMEILSNVVDGRGQAAFS